jgi:hypothetical protein
MFMSSRLYICIPERQTYRGYRSKFALSVTPEKPASAGKRGGEKKISKAFNALILMLVFVQPEERNHFVAQISATYKHCSCGNG